MDREDGFVDRGRGVWSDRGGADERPRGAVHDDGQMPESRLELVAAGARSEVGDLLEGIEARGQGALEAQSHRRKLGFQKDGSRNGPIVGRHRLAERHPHGELALVVRDVREHLGAGWVADQIDAVRDSKTPVRAYRGRIETERFQPQAIETEVPAECHQNPLALNPAPVAISTT
jgi:hypothetical protein